MRRHENTSHQKVKAWSGVQLVTTSDQLTIQAVDNTTPAESVKTGDKEIDELDDYVILDSGSMVNLFMNPNLVKNIKESFQTLELSTNAGSKMVKKEADFPGFGKVWFDVRNAIANILSFTQVVQKYRVTFDSAKENAFLVHMPKGIVKFKGSPKGLYHCKMPFKGDTTTI